MQGTYLDPEFKECVKCMDKFGCQTCTHNGCLGCVGNGEASCFMGSFKIWVILIYSLLYFISLVVYKLVEKPSEKPS